MAIADALGDMFCQRHFHLDQVWNLGLTWHPGPELHTRQAASVETYEVS